MSKAKPKKSAKPSSKETAPSAQPPKANTKRKASAQPAKAKGKRKPSTSAQQPDGIKEAPSTTSPIGRSVQEKFAKARAAQEAGTMTIRETAQLLGCHTNHVRWLIKNGKVQGTKVQIMGTVEQWFLYTQSVQDYMTTKQNTGWPRGKARTGYKKKPKAKKEKRVVMAYKAEKPYGVKTQSK